LNENGGHAEDQRVLRDRHLDVLGRSQPALTSMQRTGITQRSLRSRRFVSCMGRFQRGRSDWWKIERTRRSWHVITMTHRGGGLQGDDGSQHADQDHEPGRGNSRLLSQPLREATPPHPNDDRERRPRRGSQGGMEGGRCVPLHVRCHHEGCHQRSHPEVEQSSFHADWNSGFPRTGGRRRRPLSTRQGSTDPADSKMVPFLDIA
jgi:hypothetical protein